MKLTKYMSRLKTTTNNTTGKTFYYVEKCDVFSRISKAEYYERDQGAIRSDCFLTQGKGNHTYQYKTIYFNI